MSGGIKTLDDAWAAWIAGRSEDALRACVAILEADPRQVGAAALIAQVFHAEGDAAPSALVDVFVRRGDLPSAVAVAAVASDPEGARRAIAEAFGEGSPRAQDVAPAPPPLPPSPPQLEAGLDGSALEERAKKAMGAAQTERPADAPVPSLPLFGALAPRALEQLLGAWTVRPFAAEEKVVREGDEGREAFMVVRGHLRVIREREQTLLAELGPGAIFGEMALVSDAPRAACVIANEPVLLLVAARDDLERLAEETPAIGQQLSSFCRARMLYNLIRHSAILAAVAPGERAKLMRRFETRHFRADEALVRRDEQTEGLFLIASGAVSVVGRDADGDGLELARLGPGDVVGEISLVLRRPATADVVATHRTVALELKYEQFQEAIREHPELLSELYELATKREEETRTVVAQETLDVEDVVLL